MEKIILLIAIITVILYFTYIFGSHKRATKLLKKYSKVKNCADITGGTFLQASFEVLGYDNCEVQYTEKQNMDCYSPKLELIILSKDYCFKPTLSALGVAAHELGHCIQHHTRSSIYVLTNIGRKISKISLVLFAPVLICGLILMLTSHISMGGYVLLAGLILLILSVLVKFLLIPFELDASKIGIQFLKQHKVIKPSEEHIIRKILKAAANTYVAEFYRSLGIKK